MKILVDENIPAMTVRGLRELGHDERAEWTPPQPGYTADTVVPLHIQAADMPMRTQVKAAGGRWNPEKKLWFVKYGKVVGTPLEKHIYVDAS
jgi:hypothetical protein